MSIRKKISIFTMLFIMAIAFMAPVNADAATVGQVLTSPEDGWQRIDDTDENILYLGSSWSIATFDGYYKNTAHTTFPNGSINHSIKFKFKGSKLRVIGCKNSMYSANVSILIDDNKYTFSQKGVFVRGIINFEKLGLEYGTHEVTIIGNDNDCIAIDAYDIDSDGELLPLMQLTAVGGESKISLSWDVAEGATSYIIKRSTTAGGTYETIATSSAITFTDTDVDPGTTYYYIVSAIVSGTEGPDSNEASATPTETPITNVLKVVLEVDEELQLSVDDDLDVNTEMIWTSSDNTVATVDGNGVVTALIPGNTVITVTSTDGTYTDYINVLVVDDATELRLAVDLNVGKSCRLTVDDLTDTVNVTWASIDPAVATASTNGRVTAVSEGLTLVTATDEEGNIIGQVYIRVRE